MIYNLKNNMEVSATEKLDLDGKYLVLMSEEDIAAMMTAEETVWTLKDAAVVLNDFLMQSNHNKNQVLLSSIEIRESSIIGRISFCFTDFDRDIFTIPFYLTKNTLFVVYNDSINASVIIDQNKSRIFNARTPQKAFIYMLEGTINGELDYLNTIENRINDLETKILRNKHRNIEASISKVRKSIGMNRFYYEQTIDMIAIIIRNDRNIFDEREIKIVNILNERISRFSSYNNLLFEYALQLRETYKSTLDQEDNKTTKTLTIVTTIFAPLTLLTGWYGMNFKVMPELTGEHSYYYFIIAFISTLLVSIWILKKNKIF